MYLILKAKLGDSPKASKIADSQFLNFMLPKASAVEFITKLFYCGRKMHAYDFEGENV